MTVSKGDIFQIGNHIVGCGDSLDKEFVAKVIGKNKIKVILTDPPYGVAYVENKKDFAKIGADENKVIANDHLQSEEEYDVFTQKYLGAVIP
ncbi:hypothetical protein H6776_03075, partial [Candidatus Nomurabacteria bacterium]|nr:hypothetical protein [Candidatus Nomurabacteria bacterium]